MNLRSNGKTCELEQSEHSSQQNRGLTQLAIPVLNSVSEYVGTEVVDGANPSSSIEVQRRLH